MKYKLLGNTSVKIPAIGQGATGAGGRATTTSEKIKKRIDSLRFGIDMGMTFIDAAESYEGGHAEELLGQAVQGVREKVFISTKFEPEHSSFQGVMDAIEGSLRRLKTDYIDLYQTHWPNPAIPIEETMRALEKLVKDGKVRHIGISNCSLKQLKDAQKSLASNQIVSVQAEYNLYDRSVENSVLSYCADNLITVIAYSPLNQGNLVLDGTKKQVLDAIAGNYNLTIPQVILAWLVSHPAVITVVNSMNPEYTKENAKAADVKLSKEDIEKIDKEFERRVVLVPTDRIRVITKDVDDTHPIYTTIEQAIENKLNMQPSPADLALEINKGSDFLKPVELMPTEDKTGKYDYDLIRGRIRYWAWIIAYKGEKPIPAYIN